MQTLAMNVVAPTVARFTPARPASKAFAPRCVRTSKGPSCACTEAEHGPRSLAAALQYASGTRCEAE